MNLFSVFNQAIAIVILITNVYNSKNKIRMDLAV